MNYRDRHVVVTGGTGALGSAVVAALIEAGATCHVPYIDAKEADRFVLRNHPQVELISDVELTREADVAGLYSRVSKLWASIHLAGGFAICGATTNGLIGTHFVPSAHDHGMAVTTAAG